MGLSLAGSAARWAQDSFLSWDPATDTWSDEGITGRLFRADRFTTIYHRPTRRSTITQLFGKVPASLVVRRELGGETFLLSATERTEVEHGVEVYDSLRASHLVTSPSGGLAQLLAAVVSGTGDDLGPVVMTPAEAAYVDFELRTTAASPDSTDYAIGRYLMTFSPTILPREGDYLLFNGGTFLFEEPYVDGGFNMARVSRFELGYKNFTYRLPAGTGGYDPVTGVVTKGTVDRQVSMIVGSGGDRADSKKVAGYERTLMLYVFKRHIGFEPLAGQKMSDGEREYLIVAVKENRDMLQWGLEVAF